MAEHIAGQRLNAVLLALVTLGGVACGGDGNSLAPIPVTAQVNLTPAAHTIVDGTDAAGAVEFPAAGAAGAEYLVVAQLAGLGAGLQSNFSLGGQASLVDMPLTRLARRTSVADRFHGMLRARESQMARQAALRAPLVLAPGATQPPPIVGAQRTFKVCSNLDCNTTVNVTATASFVGSHAAIFVDNAAPANGFNTGDITQIGQQFDAVLYPIDTGRFGAESDIDANTVVIVLLTAQINKLVPKPDCNESFIAGYFFGGDIAPGFATQYNNGEVFYGLVPDPTGAASCAYATSYVKRLLQVTFIHEFQHMISFNQHVLLRGGQEETLWLNEGMSHLAEELGGLHYDSLGVDSTASRFFIGNLYNAYGFLADPGAVAVVTETPPGSLEERGGAWLFLRYLLDRYGPGLSSQLEQTTQVGAANIELATGVPFETLLGRYMLALYLTDLPGFTAPPELSYSNWNFRATYASLHSQSAADFPLAFPLHPDSGNGSAAFTNGKVSAGSGAYLLVQQAANGPSFSLAFRASSGLAMPASAGPQFAIARVR